MHSIHMYAFSKYYCAGYNCTISETDMTNDKGLSSIRRVVAYVSAKRRSVAKGAQCKGSKTRFNGRLRSFPRKVIPNPLPKDHEKEIVLSDDSESEQEPSMPCGPASLPHREDSPKCADHSVYGSSVPTEDCDDNDSEYEPLHEVEKSPVSNYGDDCASSPEKKRKKTVIRGGPSKRVKHIAQEEEEIEIDR